MSLERENTYKSSWHAAHTRLVVFDTTPAPVPPLSPNINFILKRVI